MIELTATGKRLTATTDQPITSGSVGLTATLTTDAAWTGLTITVVFKVGGMEKIAILSNGVYTVPWELLTDTSVCKGLQAGICGMSGTDIVYPTVYAFVGTIREGADPNADPGATPTPTAYQEILDLVQQEAASATSAAAQAGIATTKATEAATSATNAEAAKTAAEAATETKSDKVDNATEGNFASLDTDGNLKDSGKKATDFQTPLPDTTDNDGKVLSINSGVLAWVAQVIGLPSMSGNAGKLLTTDGTNAAWGNAVQATAADQIGLTVKGASGQTAHLQDWQDGNSITKAYMTSSGMCMAQMFQPIVAGQGLCNINSSNNSNIVPGNSGTIISRNVADANSALIVNQINAASTGKILDLQVGGVSKGYMSYGGNFYSQGIICLGGQFVISTFHTPTSSTESSAIGNIRIDENYIYVTTATNTWKRVALSSW